MRKPIFTIPQGKEVRKMARKNQEGLAELREAIAQIKEIKMQDSGENSKFSEAMNMAELYLFNQLYQAVGQTVDKSKG